jgi:RNA polymerase sigma factor (sigma-70 family)
VLARALDPQPDRMRLLARLFDPNRALGVSARSAPAPDNAAGRGKLELAGHRRSADQADFWSIWLAHRDYLQRYSLRFSRGNPADAEDALSEAMLKAVQAFSLSAIRNHRAWLLRLVHNACIDRHRNTRRQNRLGELTNGDGPPVPALVPEHHRSPEDALTRSQQISGLQQAMSTLPRSLAVPLLLHLDEVSDAEIARRLNITKEVVRKRRQMARDWLRRQMR